MKRSLMFTIVIFIIVVAAMIVVFTDKGKCSYLRLTYDLENNRCVAYTKECYLYGMCVGDQKMLACGESGVVDTKKTEPNCDYEFSCTCSGSDNFERYLFRPLLS